MKNKILIPLMIVAALATFFSFRYSAEGNSADEKKRVVIETVMKAIQQNHFAPREVNDSFSSNVYKKVLNNLDFDKRVFTQEDISKLSRYEFVLDENGADNFVSFFNDVNTIYSKRINDIEGYYTEALKKPFTFTGNEEINLNGEKVSYAANSADLKDRWHTYLKYRVLSRYVDLKDDQKKRQDNKDTSLKKIKTDAELEAEARESVTKNMEYYFKRMRKMKDDDRFTLFVNSIAGTVDPHTDFFPPADKARFDEQMSGTFFGIGATLQNDEGKIKIVSIVPGSPCWKQGDLKAGDYILKVAQGNAEPVDIQGYDTEDAVKLIRGKKGTEVRLTVKKVSGAIQVIPIIRGWAYRLHIPAGVLFRFPACKWPP
jgi:carboxyl-terminal processing protease